MHYVYILQSEKDTTVTYVGLTDDLKKRLVKHNKGEVSSTAQNKPWCIETYIAFSDRQIAVDFERYLKTGSGRALMKKHLI